MDDFREDRLTVWTAMLIDEWEAASRTLIAAGYPKLRRPNFAINPHIDSRFGSWCALRRIIELAESLLLEYEREAIIEVLRHEIAHQVVSETGGGKRGAQQYTEYETQHETDHGPRWKQACHVLGCDATASTCEAALQKFVASPRSALLDRINKLLTHGRCNSATRAESETFLAKARQLMLKHQIELADVDRQSPHRQVYVQRPIGKLFKRMPGYFHVLGNLLANHYFVNYVQTHSRVFVDGPTLLKSKANLSAASRGYTSSGGRREWRTRLELFGSRDNVDVADYVACQLLSQAEAIWQHERRKLTKPRRSSFFVGLFEGFSEKLTSQKNAEEASMATASRDIILREHAHRQDRYADAYPKLTGGTVSYYLGDSHNAGRRAGAEIHVKPGVKTGSAAKQLK